MMKNMTLGILLTFFLSLTFACDKDKKKDIKEELPIFECFSLTPSKLSEIISSEDAGIKQAILANPGEFLKLINEILAQPRILYVLVDKSHALSADYEPSDLKRLTDYGIDVRPGREYLQMREIALPAILEMKQAAGKEGIKLVFSSTYRSYEYQANVYKYNVDTYGKEQADRESAQPGKSQHQLGTTADFGSISDEFAKTPAGKWLNENAGNFGFSLSYPDGYEAVTGYRWESWHYRYISQTGIKMQEAYFQGIQQYMLEFLNKYLDIFAEYKIVNG